jgi:hypothetical protein
LGSEARALADLCGSPFWRSLNRQQEFGQQLMDADGVAGSSRGAVLKPLNADLLSR